MARRTWNVVSSIALVLVVVFWALPHDAAGQGSESEGDAATESVAADPAAETASDDEGEAASDDEGEAASGDEGEAASDDEGEDEEGGWGDGEDEASPVSDLTLPEAPVRPEADLEAGRVLYVSRCALCHGIDADGEGPAARQMDPRPRDLTSGMYKLRTTPSGSLPEDGDIFRTLSHGMRGTAMPPFAGLSSNDRWQLVFYLQSLSPRFASESPGTPVEVPAPPMRSYALIERGRKVYEVAACGQCHGADGRGDGAASDTMKDDQGRSIYAFDMTRGWKLKGGRDVRSIYRTFHTGLDGTPMPAYVETLSESDSWALAYFIESLFLDSPDSH